MKNLGGDGTAVVDFNFLCFESLNGTYLDKLRIDVYKVDILRVYTPKIKHILPSKVTPNYPGKRWGFPKDVNNRNVRSLSGLVLSPGWSSYYWWKSYSRTYRQTGCPGTSFLMSSFIFPLFKAQTKKDIHVRFKVAKVKNYYEKDFQVRFQVAKGKYYSEKDIHVRFQITKGKNYSERDI